jgi:hypothetical protein
MEWPDKELTEFLLVALLLQVDGDKLVALVDINERIFVLIDNKLSDVRCWD